MAKILTRCPVCQEKLGVSELACTKCDTHIHGKFETCRFCQLLPEHLAFLEVFLRCEGNISRVEKELGISYPTVRNRLTAALVALNLTDATDERTPEPPLPPTPPNYEQERRSILEALALGEISAEDAALALRGLNG